MIISTDECGGTDVIYRISETVAAQTDTDMCELPPLYEAIDPDALDSFLQCSNGTDARPERSVEFSYCDHRVTVDSTGQIQLDPEPESLPST